MDALHAMDAWTAPRRSGYDASAAETAARVVPMLADERVVWLSTVRPDGTPHLCPTWFWWDGGALVVFSKPEAVKVRNLRANPRLMIALGDPEDDFSVGLIEAEAAIADAPVTVPDAFFAKYAQELAAGRIDPATFRALYTQSIRIVPTRFLAWHGRAHADDVVPVAAPGRGAGLAVRLAAALDRVATRLRVAAVSSMAASASA